MNDKPKDSLLDSIVADLFAGKSPYSGQRESARNAIDSRIILVHVKGKNRE